MHRVQLAHVPPAFVLAEVQADKAQRPATHASMAGSDKSQDPSMLPDNAHLAECLILAQQTEALRIAQK